FFSSRRRHTRFSRDWSSDVCSSDLNGIPTLSSMFNERADHPVFFYVAILFLIGSFCFTLYKSLVCNLPAIMVGYTAGILGSYYRSEERRVGKECRSWWSRDVSLR